MSDPLRAALELAEAVDDEQGIGWSLSKQRAKEFRAALAAARAETERPATNGPGLDWRHTKRCLTERGGAEDECNCGLTAYRAGSHEPEGLDVERLGEACWKALTTAKPGEHPAAIGQRAAIAYLTSQEA